MSAFDDWLAENGKTRKAAGTLDEIIWLRSERRRLRLTDGDWVTMGRKSGDEWYVIESAEACGYSEFSRLPFWMPLPEPPEVK